MRYSAGNSDGYAVQRPNLHHSELRGGSSGRVIPLVTQTYLIFMSFKVGDITAEPGTKAYGFLKVGTTSVNTYRIPVAIVNGAKPGKAVCVLGGTHGTEHAGIESVIRTVNDLNPKEMTGALVAITVVNGPQFEHNSAFLSPFDSQNQNRVFPGDPEGTLSYRTAYVVFNEAVSKCDALVDTHGGDVNEDITGFVIATDGEDPAVSKMSLDMAKCYDGPYVTVHKMGRDRMSTSAQNIYGIPSIVAEAGTPYPVREKDVVYLYEGLKNILKYMNVLPGEPKMANPAVNPEKTRYTAKEGGIWRTRVEAGDYVKAGDLVCEVTDLFGKVLQTVTAPKDAYVSTTRTFYAVNCGEMLVDLHFI